MASHHQSETRTTTNLRTNPPRSVREPRSFAPYGPHRRPERLTISPETRYLIGCACLIYVKIDRRPRDRYENLLEINSFSQSQLRATSDYPRRHITNLYFGLERINVSNATGSGHLFAAPNWDIMEGYLFPWILANMAGHEVTMTRMHIKHVAFRIWEHLVENGNVPLWYERDAGKPANVLLGRVRGWWLDTDGELPRSFHVWYHQGSHKIPGDYEHVFREVMAKPWPPNITPIGLVVDAYLPSPRVVVGHNKTDWMESLPPDVTTIKKMEHRPRASTSLSDPVTPSNVSTSLQLPEPYHAPVDSNPKRFQLSPQTQIHDPQVMTNISSPSQPFVTSPSMSPHAIRSHGHPPTPIATPSESTSPNHLFIQHFVDSMQDIPVFGIGGRNLTNATPTTFSGVPNSLPLQHLTTCTEDNNSPHVYMSQPVPTAPHLTWSDPFDYSGNDGSVLDSVGLLPSPQDQALYIFTSADPLSHDSPALLAFTPPLNLSTVSNFPTPPDRPALSFNPLEFRQPQQDGYQNFTTLRMGCNPPCGIQGQSSINVPVSSTMIPPSYGANVIPESQTDSWDVFHVGRGCDGA